MLKQRLIVLTLAALLGGCNAGSGGNNQDGNHGTVTYTTPLNVVTANLWLSLSQDFNGVSSYKRAVEEFRHADADILLLSEASGISARLAEELNMYYWQGDDGFSTAGILSRYPIKQVFNTGDEHEFSGGQYNRGGNIGAMLDVNGRDVVVWANHLDYTNYITYDARGGNGVTWRPRLGCEPVRQQSVLDSMNEKSDRPDQVRYMTARLAPYLQAGTPVFVAGDFNEPSGIDWTEDTAYMFDHKGTVHDFKSHRLMLDAGLTDSWRDLFPDPASHPGLTWPFHADDSWTKSRAYVDTCGRALDDRDRIDFVYYNKAAEGQALTDASIIGPRVQTYFPGPHGQDEHYQWNDPHSGIMVDANGEPRYGERDFVSDHLWIKNSYTLETPAKGTATESLVMHPVITLDALRAAGNQLEIQVSLSNLNLWDDARQYNLVLSANTTSSRLNAGLGWQHQVLGGKPDAPRTIRVEQASLQKLVADTNSDGLQVRLMSPVGGWKKQYAVLTIPTTDIEKHVNLPEPPKPAEITIENQDALDADTPMAVAWAEGTDNANQWFGIFPKGSSGGTSLGWAYARTDLGAGDSLSDWQTTPQTGSMEGSVKLPSLRTLLAPRGHTVEPGNQYQLRLMASGSSSDVLDQVEITVAK